MGERDLRFRAYAWAVCLAAGAGLWATWSLDGYGRNWALLLTLALAVVVSELLAVDLPNGASMSLTYPLGVCTIVLFGPTASALLAVLSMLPFLVGRGRSTPSRTAGNIGQLALSAIVPAWGFVALGGNPLALQRATAGAIGMPLVPGLVAATLGILVNFALGGWGYSLVHDVPLRSVWRQLISWMIPSQVALGLIGLAIAQVMAGPAGPLGFILFVVPLVVARQTYRRYLALREAYADTVRSLVAALEAKDPYTKGHSVRVAKVAVRIAGAVGLTDAEIESIEWAALLHDLGKIGISRSVLGKPSALTEEEYERVRQHPDIAAHILESVPFLDSVRPAVQDHHERVDGLGYARGLRGDDLSLSARILAVADSYDAMTADRPYRKAMSAQDALEELLSNAGTQFDGDVVSAFAAVWPSTVRDEAHSANQGQGQGDG